MSKLAVILAGASAAALLAGPAQAYDWGGGTCVGYGCARVLDDGYRPVRQYRRVEEIEERPVRVIERRSVRRVYEIDEDDDED
ncbi:hypothetical protein HNR00_002797 [Methylorubrum rhodinum]|jgi:hypothetical protein|uniref:Uncharacterized protein n=1 Tax=Methylorubrum rhodinum TaxID=29428 RepID=A0A840ZJD7_9HYPH|nr:hypothetical protein [Methylorubrum rhodinum]MBB5758079.1 hypothetical protein [Methylorubrum rhodinum]